MNDGITITITAETLEAAINCTQALADDRREPERYRLWYEQAVSELREAKLNAERSTS